MYTNIVSLNGDKAFTICKYVTVIHKGCFSYSVEHGAAWYIFNPFMAHHPLKSHLRLQKAEKQINSQTTADHFTSQPN